MGPPFGTQAQESADVKFEEHVLRQSVWQLAFRELCGKALRNPPAIAFILIIVIFCFTLCAVLIWEHCICIFVSISLSVAVSVSGRVCLVVCQLTSALCVDTVSYGFLIAENLHEQLGSCSYFTRSVSQSVIQSVSHSSNFASLAGPAVKSMPMTPSACQKQSWVQIGVRTALWKTTFKISYQFFSDF